ncbi:MAG: V-type ATP synthase subunit I, partial [Treponema sp.]|nr:V-type ATP synthase subunit I [Treponema sp.]
MIVPMKKVSVIVTDKTREASLEKLRDLGVVHLEKRDVSSEGLSKLLDRKAKIETVQGLLRSYQTDSSSGSQTGSAQDYRDMVTEVLALSDERKNLQEQSVAYVKEKARIERWGDFKPAALKDLAAQGVALIPYNLPVKSYEALGKEQQFVVLSKDKSTVYGVAVGAEIAGEIPFPLPEYSLSELDKLNAAAQTRLSEIEKQLVALAAKKGSIDAELADLLQDIEFETAKVGMETTTETPAEFAVSWLVGYVPQDDTGSLKRAAAENGWALLVEDPGKQDNPPTLVKNNAFIRLIQPLFSMLGTVPGYREYDISLSYLLFFSFFFAMIFGDAGYGAILFVGALIFGLKSKKATGTIPDGILLLGLLSLTTIAWGVLTGSFFAVKFDHPFFKPKIPFLETEQNIKWICFIVGTGQLVLAHLKNIKRAFPSLVFLAQLGWLAMVLGLYFLVLNLVLSTTEFPVPSFAVYLIGGGLGTFFIFSEQKGGSFLKNVVKSFSNFLPTFLSAVSSFSDIISYIRLFAVGLAGAAIAGSFNDMAAGALSSGPVGIVGGIVILVLGHGLNLTMNALSVVVHGVRLNLLEYAGHLGMEWSGYAYSPFALKSK